MKTSKRLLSLFLSLVMIITSCSVGFTAFAADGNKTDSNNSYWNNKITADAGFESVNSLLTMLLQIGAIKNLLEAKNDDGTPKMNDDGTPQTPLIKEVTDSTTISDVVKAASPLLFNLLTTKVRHLDLSVIKGPNIELTYDKESFLAYKLGKEVYGANKDFYNKKYEPLDGTDEDFLDFYALYGLCVKYKDDKDKDLAKYCTDTLPLLDALFDSIPDPVLKPHVETDKEKGDKWMDTVNTAIALDPYASNFSDYENAVYDGKALKDYTADDINATDGKYLLAYYNNFMDKLGREHISNLAQLTFLDRSSLAKFNLIYALYFKLASDAGISMDTTALGVSGSTAKEVADNYRAAKDYAAAIADSSASCIGVPDTSATDEHNQAKFEDLYEAYTFNMMVFDPIGKDINALNSEGDVITPYFKDFTKAMAQQLGIDVTNAELTDEQIAAMAAAAQAANDGAGWTKDSELLDYLNGSDVSQLVKDYFTVLDAKKKGAVVDLAKALSTDGVNAKFTDAEQNFFNLGGYTTLKDRVNAIIFSNALLNQFAWIEKRSEMENSNVTSAVNIYPFYLEYIANTQGEDPMKDPYEPYPEDAPVYHYADYAFDDSLFIPFTNAMINSLVEPLLNMDLVKNLFAGLSTRIDLAYSLDDLWVKLYEKPAETVFELIPVLTVLLDEAILPILFREEDGEDNLIEGLLLGLIDKLAPVTQSKGSNIGIGQLHFDLNIMLPAILHYVTGDTAYAVGLIKGATYDGSTVPVLDKDENPVLDENGNPKTQTYDAQVFKFSNIYIVDAIVTQSPSPEKLAEIINTQLVKDESKNWIGELVATAAVNLRKVVDDFMAEHKDETRYSVAKDASDNYVLVEAQKGLNYLPVSLPYFLDYLGRNFNARNHVDSDWTYVYEGKIQTKKVTFKPDKDTKFTVDMPINVHFQGFKNFAVPGSGALPSDILEHFVDMLIGNWVNGLLDFLNDNIMDGSIDNQFIGKLPLAQGLLEALGGFGDTSIITDALNGLFQLKRCDDASFTLTKREKTGFVGFSSESAMFLINNILFVKNGEKRGLIPFIKGFSNKAPATTETPAAADTTPVLTAKVKEKTVAAKATDYDKLLSEENKAAAQVLIDILDELLSSLLENTSINGFDADSTENLLSGVVTVFAAYFGAQNTNDLLKLLNNYLFYVVGERVNHPSHTGKIGNDPTADGNVDKDKVYTSANLSNLVIQTYSFLENIVDYFFYKNNGKGVLLYQDPNELVADALYGIVSPDAVAMRLSKDYADTAKILKKRDYHNWNSFKVEITALDEADAEYNKHDFLKYGFKKGDKDAFYKALGESFNGVAAVLGALFATSYADAARSGNLYSTVLHPVLNTLAGSVGAKAPMSIADYNKAYAEGNYPSTLIDGVVLPIGNILAPLYGKPFTFILNLVRGLGGILRDSSVQGILGGLVGTVNLHLTGLGQIIAAYTPSGAASLMNTINNALGGLELAGIKIGDLLNGKGAPMKNVGTALLRSLLGNSLPFILPDISMDRLYAAKTPAETLLLIYGYVVDSLLGMDLVTSLIKSLDPEIAEILKNISASQLLTVIARIVKGLKSPTEAFWSFSEYKKKIKNSFHYPNKLTATEAYGDVAKLDNIVANVFPLLNSFGVTDIEGLPQLINDKLYTNEIITKLAKAMYGAMAGNDTVRGILAVLNIDVTPAGLAAYLTDKSYGKTYTSAAKALKKAKNWDEVGIINWGFTDGTAKAQNGFINGLAAALRPLNNVLSLLLCEGNLDETKIDTRKVVAIFEGRDGESEILTDKGPESKKFEGKHENAATLKYKVKDNKLVLTVQSYNLTGSGNRTTKSEIIIDLDAIAKDLNALIGEHFDLNFGTNGYENAIIPLLEAFMCRNIKTYKQYKKDYKKAKDNLLINILKPIGGLLDDLAAAPFDTLTAILPNVAYFIDSNGVSQAVGNLLAPILSDDGVLGVLKKNGFDLEKLLTTITGKSLGKILADFLDYEGKITLHLNNLKTFNIQDIVLPLVNKLLGEKFGIKLPKFTWAQIASHGTIRVVSSAARNDKGKFTTRQVEARQGEVLFATLTYLARTIINNAKALKKLIGGIDAIKNNKTIKKIVDSIFDNIAVAKPEDITGIIVYLLNGNPTDKFFDYRGFKYKGSSFSWGELDEDFCRQLAPMLDGLIKGLINDGEGLTALVSEKLYTDELVAKAATGIYGAIEGVKVGDGSLTDLLIQTNIDFSTDGVAALLTDSAYGRSYPGAASVIRRAGSWANVKTSSLKFGVNGRDSFIHALTAVLRPMFGVLDVLLNDASLNIFNMVDLPGSDGYTSTIVPLLEALGVYNIKTQYEYRKDIYNEYDCILLDILNPLWDKVEDVLAAPLETVADILPNLALFFANGGLAQILDNLLTPITALLDVLRPVADINEILVAAGLDVPKLLKDKVGITMKKFDLYDLQGTLNGLIGADRVVPLINAILPKINIGGASLNLELPDIDWLELASCGELITDQPSQAACFGRRMYVKSDQDITLITVLRYLIKTINYKDNYQKIVDLVGGIDGMSDTVAQVVGEVLGMLQGDTDAVIKDLIDLLQSLAG